jgi:glycosyltransferase involved in cell wall biosynthesis
MAGWSCSVAPIRVGSGTRIKILDAFRHGCPVVSTTLGCSGLDVTHDRELLIADRPDDFAKACVELCRNGDLRGRLRARAHRTWEERFTPEAIAPVFQSLLRGLPAACPTS